MINVDRIELSCIALATLEERVRNIAILSSNWNKKNLPLKIWTCLNKRWFLYYVYCTWASPVRSDSSIICALNVVPRVQYIIYVLYYDSIQRIELFLRNTYTRITNTYNMTKFRSILRFGYQNFIIFTELQ